MIVSRSWKMRRGQQGERCAEKAGVSKDRDPATEKSEVKGTQDQESYDGGGQCMLRGLQSCSISPFLAGVLLHGYHWFISLSSKLSEGPSMAGLCLAHDYIFGTTTFKVSWRDEMGGWALTA